jgi:hypothetical protein
MTFCPTFSHIKMASLGGTQKKKKKQKVSTSEYIAREEKKTK